ncbi:MAG: transcription termination factor NusA [Bacteroidales bacterium]
MENINLTETFNEFKELKNIDRPTMMGVLEDVFRGTLQRLYGTSDNFDVIINIDKGDFEIWRNRTIVADGEVEDPVTEIALTEALKIDDTYEIGDEVTDEVRLIDFGRRAVLALRQNLAGRIADMEKQQLFKKYSDRIGQLVVGEVYQTWKKEALILDDEGNELVLPKTEQIPSDFLRKGDTIRAVVHNVEIRNGTPLIILSRCAGAFLERLFELEVPEIFDGIITIKKIVREPGERAKVAVESYDERIDPVGACVGMNGSRIRGIVRELKNENIDVINYTSNIQLLVQRALNPAKISGVKINEETKRIEVYLQPTEISMAIGKGGHNIKLAGQLVGYEIDVYREDAEQEEDVSLMEFSDEIEAWVIDEFKNIGCDTAKSVLRIPREDLIKRTDLEEETIDEVLGILSSEFEDE